MHGTYRHSTFDEPCDSGPERPNDGLCEAHGLMIVENDYCTYCEQEGHTTRSCPARDDESRGEFL